jgi:hypothetical protein
MSNFDMIQFDSSTNLPATMDLNVGGGKVPKISTEGGLFTLKLDGIASGKPQTELDVIIIGQFNRGTETQRTFYKGSYTPGATDRPACASDNGVTPRDDAQEPQSDKCSTCPRNKSVGGARRECSFYTTLAVVLPGGDQPFQLRVPATSMFGEKKEDEDYFSLNAYKVWFASKGAMPINAVTKLAFKRGSQRGYSFIPVRASSADEIALAGEAVDSESYGLIMRSQALLTANKAAQIGEETRDDVKQPAARAAAQVADEDVPFDTKPKAEVIDAVVVGDGEVSTRTKSLANALGRLDD